MEAVGQTEALRLLFSEVYESVRPTRLAVLGCTAGADFGEIDPALTDVAVGVDINPEYLEAARHRLAALGRPVELVCGDILTVSLAQAPFDLVHAALLLEYIDMTSLLQRVHFWLRPGGYFSVVSQEPHPCIAAVSTSGHVSLLALAGCMSLRSGDEIEHACLREGFTPRSRRMLQVPNGKALVHSIFVAAPAAQPAVAVGGASPRR
jgi:SAM-dependent methyltransferase